MRAMTSAKFTPTAAARTRTSPGPGVGSGASFTARTPGGPLRVIQTCLMPRSILKRATEILLIARGGPRDQKGPGGHGVGAGGDGDKPAGHGLEIAAAALGRAVADEQAGAGLLGRIAGADVREIPQAKDPKRHDSTHDQ